MPNTCAERPFVFYSWTRMKLFLTFVLLCGCSVLADDSNPSISKRSHQYTYILNELTQLKRTVARLQQSIANQQRNGPVAFTARLYPTKRHLGAGQTIIFGSVLTNVGGGYSSKSGMFTAPVKGVYVFNYAAMLSGGNYEYLELVKDGHHLLWNYPHAAGANHYASSSRTATVQLNKGNHVWIRTENSATHGTGYIHGNGFSTFSGWLLQ